MNFTGMLQLALDGGLRAMKGGGPTRDAVSQSLRPGSHIVYPTRIQKDQRGREYLHAGPMHRSFWRTIEWRLVRELVPGITRPLADIGCGDGEFGKMLFSAVDLGVDGEAETIQHCEPEIYKKTALVDLRREMPTLDGTKFATCFSNSTLEHIEGVDDVLRNLARATAPGGRFIATVPSAGLIRAFSNAFNRSTSDRLNAILGHHNLWTAKEWTDHLTRAGYRTVRTRGYMTDAAAGWYASLHLPPFPQLQRRSADRLWQSNLSRFLDLVDTSLAERAEDKTACLLLDAER